MFNLEHSDHVIVHSYARFVGTRINIKCMQFYSLTTTVEWLARQAKEAFPWKEAPRYLIRDRNRAYGAAFTRRLRAMGIPAKILALAVEMIELQCCLLRCVISEDRRLPALISPAVTQGSPLMILPLDSGHRGPATTP